MNDHECPGCADEAKYEKIRASERARIVKAIEAVPRGGDENYNAGLQAALDAIARLK